MPFKSFRDLKQDLKDGLGSLSRRSFDFIPIHHHRSRSMSSVLDETQVKSTEVIKQSCWATMPPELLRDIIQRVEASENIWPSRKNFVACACVCRSWRNIAKELTKPPEYSGKLSFPISLRQPGPRDNAVQCFIKRDRHTNTYRLFLGLTTTLSETGKFLLAARKVRRPQYADYIISLSQDDISRGSNTYIGKLRSNFLGTKFSVYDSQPPHSGAIASTTKGGRRVGSKQVAPRPAGSYNVAHVAYELNVLGTRGPRRMHCTMFSIPASCMEPGGVAPTPVEFSSAALEYSLSTLPSFGSKSSFADFNFLDSEAPRTGTKDEPLILKNKTPRWHEQLQCWCLNFRGRVTVASVKNFQLVAANGVSEPQQQTSSQNDHEKVLLQFGKVGKDMFTMDYRYPLSAFQAFAICLSSFDTKLACE